MTSKRYTSIEIDTTEFRKGWRVLILALIGICTSVGVAPLYAFGSLVLPLQDAFGWSRGEVQAAISFQFASVIFAIQITGWLNKRYGLRPVALYSLILLPFAYLAATLNTGSLWQLYLSFVLIVFAGLGTLQVTWTQLVCLWFEKNRGLALAIILSGTGLAAILLPTIISWSVNLWDWRAGFWVLAALSLLGTLPLSLFWLTSTGPVVQSAEKNSGEEHPDAGLTGLSLREAVATWRFWIATLALVLTVIGTMGIVTNAVPMMRDNGLSASDAAHVFGAFGISLVFGRVISGYLIDRLWAPGVAFVVFMLPAVGCLFFVSAETHMPTLVLASILVGFGAGAEFDLASFLMARYFGLRDYSRIFSLHLGFSGLGGCISPVFFAYLFERTGSYTLMLTYCTIGFAAGALLMLTLGRYPVLSVATSRLTLSQQ